MAKWSGASAGILRGPLRGHLRMPGNEERIATTMKFVRGPHYVGHNGGLQSGVSSSARNAIC